MDNIRERTCRQCGSMFQGGPRAWFCPSCRKERAREQLADHRRRRSKGDYRPIGSFDTCLRCGNNYEILGGNHKYCNNCSKDAVAEIDNIQGTLYYLNNKDDINTARREKRKTKHRKCVICGAEYLSSTVTKCCSQDCRITLKQNRWKRFDEKKRKQ